MSCGIVAGSAACSVLARAGAKSFSNYSSISSSSTLRLIGSHQQPHRKPVVSRRLAGLVLILSPLQSAFPKRSLHSTRLGSSNSRMESNAAASRASLDLEAFGKAASGSGSPSKERGDCPFSQRIYLELEEKGLPYTATYIEEGPNKPDWFMAKNPAGLMPVLRDGEEWIQDSDKISQHLEQKYPEHSLKTPPHLTHIGAGIFPAFTKWLKSKDVNDPAKQEYVGELKALNEHLQAHGPFIAGKEVTNSDFALAPKLRHARVALAHYMQFQIPQEFSAIREYIEKIESRPSFRKTDSPDEMILEGWKKKFELPDQIAKQPQPA